MLKQLPIKAGAVGRMRKKARSTRLEIQSETWNSEFIGRGVEVKSVQKKLLEAAELATSIGITNIDIESIDIYDYGTVFRLKPTALSRVFRENRIPRSKLELMDLGGAKKLWVYFNYRGVRWSTYISSEVMEDFKTTIEANSVDRIQGSSQP